MLYVRPVGEPPFDPYAPPGAAASRAMPALPRSPVRTGAFVVLLGEASRSILWRLNGAIGLAYPGWPDATVPNRVIKLLGAVVVAWGAWLLTRERVPAFARVATRTLVAMALVGHFARLVFALVDVTAFASEPATMIVDAVALSACVLCTVPALRVAAGGRWARSGVLLAVAYLAVSVASASLLLASASPMAHVGGAGLRGAISLAMVALGGWGVMIAAHLPRTDP
jgi:hypothetical protein